MNTRFWVVYRDPSIKKALHLCSARLYFFNEIKEILSQNLFHFICRVF